MRTSLCVYGLVVHKRGHALVLNPVVCCRENERLNQTFHGKSYKKFDTKTHTWKTVYISPEDEENIKWYSRNHVHRHWSARAHAIAAKALTTCVLTLVDDLVCLPHWQD